MKLTPAQEMAKQAIAQDMEDQKEKLLTMALYKAMGNKTGTLNISVEDVKSFTDAFKSDGGGCLMVRVKIDGIEITVDSKVACEHMAAEHQRVQDAA